MTTVDDLCHDCGHKIRLHDDPYGCQYEYGDAWVSDSHGNEALEAQGTCGCKAHSPKATSAPIASPAKPY